MRAHNRVTVLPEENEEQIQRFLETNPNFRRVAPGRLETTRQAWVELPEALARRLVVRAFAELGASRDLDHRHLERVLEFLREGPGAPGGREIELPGALRLRREGGRLVLYRKRPEIG